MKNDRRPYNNNNRRNNSRPQKPRKCILTVPLFIDDSVDDDLYNEIVDALAECPFNKVSYPLGAARWVVHPDQDMDENYRMKLMTIGYVQEFDPDNVSFTVVVFNNASEVISKIEKPVISLQYITTRDGGLRTITKINIEPTFSEDEDTENTVEEVAVAEEKNIEIPSEAVVQAEDVHVTYIDNGEIEAIENDCAD